MTTAHEHLTRCYQQSGFHSYAAVRDRVRDILGDDITPSEQTIRNYHTGETKKPDLLVLAALAEVYGTTAKEVVPELTVTLDSARDLLIRSIGCFRSMAGQLGWDDKGGVFEVNLNGFAERITA